jgi:hypothetical protein
MRARVPLGVDLLFTTLMGEIRSAIRDTELLVGRDDEVPVAAVVADLGVVGCSVS